MTVEDFEVNTKVTEQYFSPSSLPNFKPAEVPSKKELIKEA